MLTLLRHTALSRALLSCLLTAATTAPLTAQTYRYSKADGIANSPPNTQTLIASIPAPANTCPNCIISNWDAGFANIEFYNAMPSSGLQELRLVAELRVDELTQVRAPNGQGGQEFVRFADLGIEQIRTVAVVVTLEAVHPTTGEVKRAEMRLAADSRNPVIANGSITVGGDWPLATVAREKGSAGAVNNHFKFRVSNVEWREVRHPSLSNVDFRIRQRLREAGRTADGTGASGAAGTPSGSTGAGSTTAGSTTAGSTTAGTTAAGTTVGAGSNSATISTAPGTNATTAGAGARPGSAIPGSPITITYSNSSTVIPPAPTPSAASNPAALPPPPAPVPYDRAAAARFQAQVEAEFSRIRNETDAMVRRGEQERAAKQAAMDRAVEREMQPLLRLLEARAAAAKREEIQREWSRLRRAMDDVRDDVDASLRELDRDERGLVGVLAKHPGLPSVVQSAIDGDLRAIRALRERKLTLLDDHAAELEEVVIETSDLYEGDVTKAYTDNVLGFGGSSGNKNVISDTHLLSSNSMDALRSAAIPAGRKTMIAVDLGPVLIDNALRHCQVGMVRTVGDTYATLGGRDSRVLGAGAEADAIVRYEWGLSAARVRLQSAADSLPLRFGTVELVMERKGQPLQYGVASRAASASRPAVGALGFRGMTGMIDPAQELQATIADIDLAQPLRRYLGCKDLVPISRVVDSFIGRSAVYVRPGTQKVRITRALYVPALVEVPVNVVAGQTARVDAFNYASQFRLDPILAKQGRLLNGQFSMQEYLLRNLRAQVRPGALLEADMSLFSQRVMSATRYYDGKLTRYIGMDYANGSVGLGAPEQIVRGFGSETVTREEFFWFQGSMLTGVIGYAKRIGGSSDVRAELSVPVLSMYQVRFTRSRTEDGINAFSDEDVMTTTAALNPTLSIDLSRVLPMGRIGLRYATTFWWLTRHSFEKDDGGSLSGPPHLQPETRALMENFFSDRMTHAFTLTIRF